MVRELPESGAARVDPPRDVVLGRPVREDPVADPNMVPEIV
jgi:hypothetical protein